MTHPIHVLSLAPLSDALLAPIRAVSPRISLTVREPAEAGEAWRDAEVLLTRGPMPGPGQAPKLKWVQWWWAGVNALLENEAARQVVVTSASGIHSTQLSEWALTMILAFARRLPNVLGAQQRAAWEGWPNVSPALMPAEVRGATLGIVGYGSIGRETARLARAFGMRVLAAKRDVSRRDDSGYQALAPGDPDGAQVERLFPPTELRAMLAECDYVFLIAPLTPETRNLIGAEELRAMKPAAVLLNAARGEVVDEAALAEALRSGVIGGAALDVFTQEPLPSDSPLWRLPNVIVSQHLGGVSAQYADRLVALFCENLRRYAAGETLLNIVDWEKGY